MADMTNVAEQLEAIDQRVFSSLKDFQKATVSRIEKLYIGGQRRVLVSDEVGLGKTLIARGVIAKVAKIQKNEGDDLFKVVYVCSNGAIADQNLRKLRITREAKTESVFTSRLSMQHLTIYKRDNDPDLHRRYIQLIPLTPDTSFRVSSGRGAVGERALMFALLKRIPDLETYQDELEAMMMHGARKSWPGVKNDYEAEAVRCDEMSNGRYFSEMIAKLDQELRFPDPVRPNVYEEILPLCEEIRKNPEAVKQCVPVISRLRLVFARISLDKLEPDLVIMDEFQRFRYLLEASKKQNDSETGMLAYKFFHAEKVRMLLLSATPYKMYSTMEEIDETNLDEHYEEFLTVMRFLNENAAEEDQFETVWSNYTVRLKELTFGDTAILAARKEAEDAMYKTVCRTERISEKENADIIDTCEAKPLDKVLEGDIRSYIQIQQLLDDIQRGTRVPIDYIKSSPYLLSFMKEYQLKKDIQKYFSKHPDETDKLRKDLFWLKRNALDRYETIPNNNSRLDHVMNLIMAQNASKLLWIPPSLPYYEPGGIYRGVKHFSKTLVFSSWEMVPRMLACLLSYEAERQTIGDPAIAEAANRRTEKEETEEGSTGEKIERQVKYFADNQKRYPPDRMSFSSAKNGKPSSMTLFSLLYPSRFLIDCYDPVTCVNDKLKLREIRRMIGERIRTALRKIDLPHTGRIDPNWYYLAPMLLDGEEYAHGWLNAVISDAEKGKSNEEGESEKASHSPYRMHLNTLKSYLDEALSGSFVNLGKCPKDLVEVLTDMAIAAPAVCAGRTYQAYLEPGTVLPANLPTQLALVFLSRMNTVESTAVVELTCASQRNRVHWKNLLMYCRHGNLQAVLDEYAHLISSGLDLDDLRVFRMHELMREAMNIKTTSYKVDTRECFLRSIRAGKDEKQIGIRTHFATAFIKGDEKEANINRKKIVRDAFNSPFRPFVLATTSIGQEGLDFHFYCRRIVHWNLPSNPIDLEQREGRINRFECLAIRQNIARRYGNISFRTKDIWSEMFRFAEEAEKINGASELIPYWGLRNLDKSGKSDDMIKIERVIPMYPFSRDEQAYTRLKKILSMYRLTLGQARQEELLEYLFQNCDDPDQLRDLFINLSPFYKEKGDKEKANENRGEQKV